VLLKDFNLRDDPFAITPDMDKIVWADREAFLRQLKNAMRRALQSTPSRIIACIWGEWGAGKTHAMSYFSKPEVMKKIVEEIGISIPSLPISIPIIFPLDNTLDTIYLEIIGKIGVDTIIKALDKIELKFQSIRSEEAYLAELSKYMDPRVAEAFAKLKGRKRFVFERYLSMTATSTELKNAGIARGISTSTDKVRTISGILNLLTATIASRVIVWIDDLERIGDRPGKDVFEFQYFIRDLLDFIPHNLLIVFNMTLLPGEKVEERLAYLGPAIKSRISDQIIVESLTMEEYLSYVRDLLGYFRVKPITKEDEFFPFEKDALELIYAEMKQKQIPLTPRQINDVLSFALFQAMNEEGRTDPLITKRFVEKHVINSIKVTFPIK